MAKKSLLNKKSLQFLEKYLNNPSPTGYEWEGQKIWMNYLKPYVDKFITDTYGTAVAVINPDAKYKVVIEGHADERGTREYNLALGARRANSAREFLVSRGIESSRIQTVSFGKERPVELCSNENCYSENRRAVSVVSNLNF